MAEAQVRLNVDTRGAVTGLRKAQLETQKLEKQVNRTSKATASATANVQRFGIAFRSVVGPVVAITGAVNLLGRSLKTLGERQADAAALENGLRKVGAAAGELERLQKVADKLGKATLFNQEDFTRGFALLTSFQTIAVSSYKRVAEAAADVAQVTKQDVNSSLLQLAKALQDPIKGLTALSRAGTQFTDAQKEVIKKLVETGKAAEAQDFILKEIEKQYGEAAKAAGSAGYAGAVDSLGESFRDFQEQLAKGVEPAVTRVLGVMTDLFDLFSKIPKEAGQMAAQIGVATAAYIALQRAMKSVLALKMVDFITQQIALYRFFGASIYFAAGAQKAFAAASVLAKGALVALPFGLVALAVQTYYNDVEEARKRTIEYEGALKSQKKELLEVALASEVATAALQEQRVANLALSPSGKRGGGIAQQEAKKALAATNARILKLRDELNIAAERDEAEYQRQQNATKDLTKANKKKDISQKQLELENLLREAKVKGNAQEVAYIEKLLEREQIMQRDMKARERMNALLQTEFDYSEKIKALRQEIADAFTGAAVTPGQFGGEFGGIFENGGERTQHLEELKKKLKELQSPMLAIKNISGSVAEAFSTSIAGMVNGTMNAKQALANFFQSVSQSFLNMATEIIKAAIRMMAFKIITSLFPGVGAVFGASSMVAPGLSGAGALGGKVSGLGIGGSLGGASYGGGGVGAGIGGSISGATFGGFRARGGRVGAGRGYIVGENGPEYFKPSRGGEIIPNRMINLGGKFLPFHPLMLAMGGRRFMARYGMGAARHQMMDLGGKFMPMSHAIPRANGGSVSPASNYMVGEKGPEVFVPRGGGGGGGAMVVVNVDAKGTQAEGSEPNANKLGEAIGMAVRQELVRQKRPGGLLA